MWCRVWGSWVGSGGWLYLPKKNKWRGSRGSWGVRRHASKAKSYLNWILVPRTPPPLYVWNRENRSGSVHVLRQSHAHSWPSNCCAASKPQHNNKARLSASITEHVPGNPEKVKRPQSGTGWKRWSPHPHFSLVELDTHSKVMQQAWSDLKFPQKRSGHFSLSVSASFLCYGAARIYFGGLWFCRSSQLTPLTPSHWANVTYIHRWHRDPVCTAAARQQSAAPRRADTDGFRGLHNLPRSLIHLNYFIIMQHVSYKLHEQATQAQRTKRKMLPVSERRARWRVYSPTWGLPGPVTSPVRAEPMYGSHQYNQTPQVVP